MDTTFIELSGSKQCWLKVVLARRQVLKPQQLWHVEPGKWQRRKRKRITQLLLCAAVAQHVYTQACDCRGVKKWRGVEGSSCGRTTNQREHALSKRTRTNREPTRSCKSCGKVFDFMIYLWASSAAPLGNKLFANLLKPSAPCRATSSSPTPTIRFFSYSFKVPAKRIKLLMPSRLKSKANMHTIRFV